MKREVSGRLIRVFDVVRLLIKGLPEELSELKEIFRKVVRKVSGELSGVLAKAAWSFERNVRGK